MSSASLARALDLTEQMLLLALQKDWQRLNEIEMLQSGEIRSVFKSGVSFSEHDKLVTLRIKALMDQVISLSEAEMHSLNNQMMQMKKGRVATKAYEQGGS